MPCEQPIRIRNSKYKLWSEFEVHEYSKKKFGVLTPPDLYLDVPCGWCFSCQKRRLSGFALRLKFEFLRSTSCHFLTLTFDESSLHRFEHNPNKAVLLFLDRYRKKAGKQVRHFFIAEYGKKRGRLHYHGLLFNAPLTEEEEITSLWKYGRIEISLADIDSPNYVCKYMTKGTDNNKIQHRVIASKGLGDNYITPENIEFHRANGKYKPFIDVGCKKIVIPRYYLDKLFDKEDKLNIVRKRMNEPFSAYLNGKIYTNEDLYKDDLKGFNEFQKMNLLTPRKRPPYKKSKKRISKLLTFKSKEFYV